VDVCLFKSPTDKGRHTPTTYRYPGYRYRYRYRYRFQLDLIEGNIAAEQPQTTWTHVLHRVAYVRGCRIIIARVCEYHLIISDRCGSDTRRLGVQTTALQSGGKVQHPGLAAPCGQPDPTQQWLEHFIRVQSRGAVDYNCVKRTNLRC